MGKVSTQNFTVVDSKNVSDVAQKMSKDQGFILITEIIYYGYPDDVMTGDFKMALCSRFLIRLERNTIYCKTPGDFKVNAEERSYSLCPKRQPCGNKPYDSVADWLQRLKLDNDFELEISPLNLISRGLLNKKSLVLYIPQPILEHAEPAFMHAFNRLATKWNARATHEQPRQFSQQHLAQMVQYVLADLRTGAVMQHNLQAKAGADVAVGIE